MCKIVYYTPTPHSVFLKLYNIPNTVQICQTYISLIVLEVTVKARGPLVYYHVQAIK